MAGRPREFDRDHALRQAMLAFWQRGYEGTSMADLVEALGIASARIYAAFGGKEALFREAVELYEAGDGGFADRALNEEAEVHIAIERMLHDAVVVYTERGMPPGCMVVSAATNCSVQNEQIQDWLAEHRHRRAKTIRDRIQRGVDEGQLKHDTQVRILGDFYATQLNGISVQARDGVSRKHLLASIEPAIVPLRIAASI